MTHKIFRSTFITCIIVLAACFLLTFSVLYSFFEHQTENELKGEIDYIAYSIKDDYKSFFKTFSDKDKRITLISQDGTVIADTNANADEMEITPTALNLSMLKKTVTARQHDIQRH